jgi:hypothetical protein
MTHPPLPPPAPVAPAPPGRRPATVTAAAALLAVMAVVGLGYAAATIAVTPGVVARFRGAARAADAAEVDGYVTVVWLGAALGAVLAVVLVALYVVLALGLRRGSRASRVATLVVCGLGLVGGCVVGATGVAESAATVPGGSLAAVLTGAYPRGWLAVNIAVAAGQMAGYVVVAILLLVSPGAHFARRAPSPYAPPDHAVPPDPYGRPTMIGPDDAYWTRPPGTHPNG